MSPSRTRWLMAAGLAAIAMQGAPALAATPAPTPPAVGAPLAPTAESTGGEGPDVNGDGYDDLVIGVPGDDLNQAGSVTVALGNAKGPNPRQSTRWSLASPGVEGSGGGGFGSTHTDGDFDGDGYDDLAIGVPYVSERHSLDSGVVTVLYGSPTGTTADGDQRWSQASPGIHGEPGGLECFGCALATGDFDADGYDDLVVGLARDEMRFVPAMHVVYGSAEGLTSDRSDYWRWPDRGSRGRSPYDGLALTAGDFNADGVDDVAWGIPTHKRAQGGVHLLSGTPAGLVMNPGDPLSQSTEGVEGRQHDGEQFGSALASDDFDGDGYVDLAVSVPSDQTGVGDGVARTVQVFPGSAGGVTSQSQLFDEYDLGLVHQPGAEDRLVSLAAGDLDADGLAELAVGFPLADVVVDGGVTESGGVVTVLPGSASGPLVAAAIAWSQETPGVDTDSRGYDYFGASASIADLDGDGYNDLTIGVTGEEVLEYDNAGAANVLYGSVDGLTGVDSELWSQAKRFVEDLPNDYEAFGVM